MRSLYTCSFTHSLSLTLYLALSVRLQMGNAYLSKAQQQQQHGLEKFHGPFRENTYNPAHSLSDKRKNWRALRVSCITAHCSAKSYYPLSSGLMPLDKVWFSKPSQFVLDFFAWLKRNVWGGKKQLAPRTSKPLYLIADVHFEFVPASHGLRS